MNDFNTIINAVAKAADLSSYQILCKRRFQETIDAKWVAVKIMKDEGFYPSRIADLMGMTTRNVNHILYSINVRLLSGDKCLDNILERSRRYLGNS